MRKIPTTLRETIARNIRSCRMNRFPGRGGGKRCAEAFGVSPQQWSPWESGKRTPDELRLEQIAKFFNTTVEWFRHDHRQERGNALPAALKTTTRGEREMLFQSSMVGGMLHPPLCPSDKERENIKHYLWVIDIITRELTESGVRVVVTFEKAAPPSIAASAPSP